MQLPSTRISTRLVAAFVLPAALVLAVNGVVAYFSARDAFREQYARKLEVLATTIAAQIDPDRVLALLPGDERERWYLDLAAELETQKRAADLTGLYLINGNGQIFVDADRRYPIEQRITNWASDAPAVVRAIHRAQETWVEDTDKEPPSYRAYKRLEVSGLDEAAAGDEPAEEEVLLLGVEAGLDYLPALRSYALTLLPLGCVSLLAVMLIALVVSRTITRPVRDLVEDARRIGSGDLEAPVRTKGSDEIAFLARTLDEMRFALEARDRDRQAMLAGIAHEVRNPLGGMELFLGLLSEELAELEERVEPEQRDEMSGYAGRITRELGYLKGVVNDFLAFARETPLARQPARLRELLDEVIGVVGGEASEREVRLELDCPAGLELEIDAGAIRRGVLNLVQNALQATPAGGEVRLGAVEVDGGVALSVRDTGKGIPADKLAEVAKPFVTTREKGTGLGLAIVNKIARAHGGALEIESAEGQGTEVRIALPRV